jgi:superfamily II DNA or RNA helicase
VLDVLPTGAGKTVIFTHIAESMAAAGKRICIVLPRVELVRQTCAALSIQYGIIKAGVRPVPWQAIQVASAQTLCQQKRLHLFSGHNSFDMIIVDEAHHATATTWRKITDAYPAAHVLGFTATPCRTDGTGLREAGYTKMVVGPTTAWLTENKFLSPALVYTPGGIDVPEKKPPSGHDYSRKVLAKFAEKARRTGCAVTHYKRFADRMPAIGFCVSVDDAEEHAAMFRDAGYMAASIDGTKSDAERRQLISDLGTGGLHVLFSCDLISEGVDVPVVACGLMLRPTQSLALWRQQVGRCLRPAPGKQHAIILDHVGNTARHGLPTDDVEWSLDGANKSSNKGEVGVSLRDCPSCFRPHLSAPVCPLCGYVHPPSPREIEQVAGELELAQRQLEQHQKKVEEWQCRSLEDFQRLAEARGYKDGWARMRWSFREKRMQGKAV